MSDSPWFLVSLMILTDFQTIVSDLQEFLLIPKLFSIILEWFSLILMILGNFLILCDLLEWF